MTKNVIYSPWITDTKLPIDKENSVILSNDEKEMLLKQAKKDLKEIKIFVGVIGIIPLFQVIQIIRKEQYALLSMMVIAIPLFLIFAFAAVYGVKMDMLPKDVSIYWIPDLTFESKRFTTNYLSKTGSGRTHMIKVKEITNKEFVIPSYMYSNAESCKFVLFYYKYQGYYHYQLGHRITDPTENNAN